MQKPTKLQETSKFKHIINQPIHIGNKSLSIRKIIFFIALALCLTPLISPPVALLIGIALAQFVGHPYLHLNHKATSLLLKISVIGLGFGMNVHSAINAGKQGLIFTVASIMGTLALGLILGRIFKIEKKTSHLISCGTAICGGSAIAAISPVIKADEKQISVALGTIFILNSVALFLFPWIGHLLELSQMQFGLWSAIAIHDTSSVVGAANNYGAEALQIATTVKLARALWIIPIALLTTLFFKSGEQKIKIPYFIGLFILAMIVNTYFPIINPVSGYLVTLAKIGLTVTLFLIGAGLSADVLKSVGFKPLLQGIILWLVISATALYAVMHFTL
ncbi:MAG: putative sulfate exporter family transporter [Ginsengibacter sp.]